MKRAPMWFLAGLSALLVVWLWAGLAPMASLAPLDITPTAWVYLPHVLRLPSPTPTETFTPTETATATATETATATATATETASPTATASPSSTASPTASATSTVPPALPMQGDLRREEPNKPSYATNIENIWHWFWMRNTNNRTVYYGILGVNVVNTSSGGSYQFFHTSWSGAEAPGGVLEIYGGGCYGPGGYPCAGSSDAAQQRDTVIVAQPGNYQMTLAICQSSFNACQQPGAAWQNLDTVTFVAIDWTPQPFAPTRTPEPCRLITNDPRGVYLKCR